MLPLQRKRDTRIPGLRIARLLRACYGKKRHAGDLTLAFLFPWQCIVPSTFGQDGEARSLEPSSSRALNTSLCRLCCLPGICVTKVLPHFFSRDHALFVHDEGLSHTHRRYRSRVFLHLGRYEAQQRCTTEQLGLQLMDVRATNAWRGHYSVDLPQLRPHHNWVTT